MAYEFDDSGQVKVWWDPTDANSATMASIVLQTLRDNHIWESYRTLLGRPTVPVPKEDSLGGDGALDWLIVPGDFIPVTIPLVEASGVPCPCRITFAAPANPDVEQARKAVAHELFHAFQFAFTGNWADDGYWLYESTAEWAAHYILPNAPIGPAEERFFDTPDLKLTDPAPRAGDVNPRLRFYGSWPLWYYWTGASSSGLDVIRKVFVRFGNQEPVLSALAHEHLVGEVGIEVPPTVPEAVVPLWHMAHLYLWQWNNPDIGTLSRDIPQFRSLLPRVERYFAYMEPDHAKNNYQLHLPGEGKIIPPLSAVFYQININDATARTITFYNGFNYKLEQVTDEDGNVFYQASDAADNFPWIHVAVFGLRGPLDRWSIPAECALFENHSEISFCRDRPTSRYTRIGVLVTNASIDKEFTYSGLPSVFRFTNIGCFRWTGNMTSTYQLAGEAKVTLSATCDIENPGATAQDGTTIDDSQDPWMDGGNILFTKGTMCASAEVAALPGARCTYEGKASGAVSAQETSMIIINYGILKGKGARRVSCHVVADPPPLPWSYKVTCPPPPPTPPDPPGPPVVSWEEFRDSVFDTDHFGSEQCATPVTVDQNGTAFSWRVADAEEESKGDFEVVSSS